MTQLADATARWNAGRIDAAVTAWNADPTGPITVSGAVQNSGNLTGYLFGNLERASVAAGAAEDARLVESANQLVALASAVVGLIPEVGPFAQVLTEAALTADGSIGSPAPTNKERAQAQMNALKDRACQDLQIAAALALADSPRLPVTIRTDANNALYPWFADHIDASTLTDRITRNTFIEWMSDDAGDIALLLPHASGAFGDGSGRSDL